MLLGHAGRESSSVALARKRSREDPATKLAGDTGHENKNLKCGCLIEESFAATSQCHHRHHLQYG